MYIILHRDKEKRIFSTLYFFKKFVLLYRGVHEKGMLIECTLFYNFTIYLSLCKQSAERAFFWKPDVANDLIVIWPDTSDDTIILFDLICASKAYKLGHKATRLKL